MEQRVKEVFQVFQEILESRVKRACLVAKGRRVKEVLL